DAALARANATPTLARSILADELRRRAVEKTLRVGGPTPSQLRQWYDTYSGNLARLVRTARPVPWLGNLKAGIAVQRFAPGRLFALDAGESAGLDGARATALGEGAPLGTFPLAPASPSPRRAFGDEQ